MNPIRYLLDENVDELYHTQLLERDPTAMAWMVGTPGAPPKGTLDPAILLWCEENSFILVTNNRRSMPTHLRDHLAQGHHAPGIFIMNADMSIGATIEELLLIQGASDANEYRDNIWFLPICS